MFNLNFASDMQDGTEWRPETIVYCTGYKYAYPWLAPGILDIGENQHCTSEPVAKSVSEVPLEALL